MLWLLPGLALGAGLLPDDSNPEVIDYPENQTIRVTSFLPAEASWSLGGEDAQRFSIARGVLRFAREGRRAFRPDFEAPADADGDNRYRLTIQALADGHEIRQALTVQVVDRDEPGRVVLDNARPALGEPLEARLIDPDGVQGRVAWRWERGIGVEQWRRIPEATRADYIPVAGDTGRHLRVVASYADRHGDARQAAMATPHPVHGPRLLHLEVRAESNPGGEIRPAFDPAVLHYGTACAEQDVLTLGFSAAPEVRLAVNGIRPGPQGAAAVNVTPFSDVAVTLETGDGSTTRYTVHCMPPALAAIGTRKPPGARPLNELLALAAGAWVAVIDENAVPRVHLRTLAEPGHAGFFLLPFGAGADRRWAYAEPGEALEWGWKVLSEWAWVVLDRDFAPILKVDTAPPLTATARHDFRLLDDGAMLLMGYEPAVHDFSLLNQLGLPGPEGEPWGTEEETRDSTLQLLEPDGRIRWSWSVWGRLPLEDCTQRGFPHDFAHLDAFAPAYRIPGARAREGILASFRDCSSVMLIDPAAPSGDEIVWRIGQSNLAPDEWARRGLGPAPLPVVDDPEGTFCSQHAVQQRPNGNLLLFDNGVACVAVPGTREPLSRKGETFSRVVEYALDHENGEAVFVRDHALRGRRDVLSWIGGHVAVLDDGDWLVSWGRGRTEPESGEPLPDEVVTRVDPDTGEETFSIPLIQSAEVPGGTVRAVPVSPLALAPKPTQLSADFPGPHADFGERLVIDVAFSRAVADFGVETPSLDAEGAILVAVEPQLAFGKPAHSYRLTFARDGEGPAVLHLVADVACQSGGICAADGTMLSAVPKALTMSSGPSAASAPTSSLPAE